MLSGNEVAKIWVYPEPGPLLLGCFSSCTSLWDWKAELTESLSLSAWIKMRGEGREKKPQVTQFFLFLGGWVLLQVAKQWARQWCEASAIYWLLLFFSPSLPHSCLLSCPALNCLILSFLRPFLHHEPRTSPTALFPECSLLMANLLQINFRMRTGNERMGRKEELKWRTKRDFLFFQCVNGLLAPVESKRRL